MTNKLFHTRHCRAKELGVGPRLFDRLVEKGLITPDAETTCGYELFSTAPEDILRDKEVVEFYLAKKFQVTNSFYK